MATNLPSSSLIQFLEQLKVLRDELRDLNVLTRNSFDISRKWEFSVSFRKLFVKSKIGGNLRKNHWEELFKIKMFIPKRGCSVSIKNLHFPRTFWYEAVRDRIFHEHVLSQSTIDGTGIFIQKVLLSWKMAKTVFFCFNNIPKTRVCQKGDRVLN